MKKNLSLLLILSIFGYSLVFTGCKKSSSNQQRENELIVYTYDSFSGEWGSGPQIAKLFQEKTGITVTYVDCGDSAQILSKAIIEKKNPYADVVIGLDNLVWEKAYENDVLQTYKPSNSDVIFDNLEEQLGGKWILTPYDYGYFAFIYNTMAELPVPECLEDLTKPVYKNKIILMDSRTSTMGIGFEQWIHSVYKDSFYDDYMKRLEPSVLTVAPGWSIGYGMFTNGEAPLVLSYVTDTPYHIYNGEGNQFKALFFKDGHIKQVEGAGIIKGAKNLNGAKKFIDFLISEEAQNVLPLTQWMFPANKNVILPECYNEVEEFRYQDN